MTATTYEEAYVLMSAPIPPEQIKKLPSGILYTTDKFVQDRLDEAVGSGGWSDDYTVVAFPRHVEKLSRNGEVQTTWIGSMTCVLTVLGVRKSATYDLEFDASMYGTPSTNAQATVFKRAAMKHGIGRELWKGTQAADAAAIASPVSSRGERATFQDSKDTRDFRKPTEAVVKWLIDLFVPEDVAHALNGNGTRDDPSQASLVITSLMEARKKHAQEFKGDPTSFVDDALSMYAPHLMTHPNSHAQPPVVAAAAAAAEKKGKRIRRADQEEEDD